uniref:Kinesin motor domain-containing protein n=1 Tax=Ditylenchus dipsaci TaxID=166011 RepID=A0A915E294_9BILA
MDRLSVGMHVDIMRSDGRVHGALVTQLRHDTRVVSVEWFEKGETKGKEVDLAALMRNNQTLFQQSLLPSNIAAPPPPSVAAPAIEKTNAVNTRMNSVENKPESRRTMVEKHCGTSRIPPVRPRVLANVPENTVVENKKEAEQPAMTPATEELIAPIPKSQVVSKIEEMEKSREQRRVQQTEAKKQREIQKNIDPGNPNWQFLSMIRDYQSQVDYKPLRMADAVVEKGFVWFTAQPLVRTIFQRGFATCFAYGQTGSGKHTQWVEYLREARAQQDCTNGIYALTATDVFKMLNSADNRNERQFLSLQDTGARRQVIGCWSVGFIHCMRASDCVKAGDSSVSSSPLPCYTTFATFEECPMKTTRDE